MRWQCIACGRQTRENPPLPCLCGVEGSWAAPETPSGTRAARARPALELGRQRVERLPTGDVRIDRLFGGGLPYGTTTLVLGLPGSGKTRLASRWLGRAPCLALSLEQPAEDFVRTVRHAGGNVGQLYVLEDELDWRAEAERLGVRAVLVDSVSDAARPVLLMVELVKWCHQRRAVGLAVSHENRKGRALGSARLEHKPEAVVRVSPGPKNSARVTVKKSRYCPKGSALVGLVGSDTGDSGRPRT